VDTSVFGNPTPDRSPDNETGQANKFIRTNKIEGQVDIGNPSINSPKEDP
jgi:hypothetical protein